MLLQYLLVTLAVAFNSAHALNGTQNASAPVIFQLSSDPSFAFNLEVTIGLSEYYGANTGEVLRAASQITPGDFESWYEAFYYFGVELQKFADNLNPMKYPVSVQDYYFRSSSYLRQSLFYLTGDPSDSRLYTVWDQAISNFDKAIALLDCPGERYNISAPLDIRPNFSAPIIFFSPNDSNEPKPTVLWGSGYDAPMEDGFHNFGRWVLDRGWNFCVYEGPGQNTVRRDQNIGFQPDWWNVVTPIVSFLGNRSDVDHTRIALTGESFGGILAPRAATHEHRLAAVIAIDGAYSVPEALFSSEPELETIYNENATLFDELLNKARNNVSEGSTLRWVINQGLWSFDTRSPHEWIELATNVNLTEADAPLITMPIFIGNAQNDSDFPHQAPVVQSWFGDRAFSYNFSNALGAGQHCQTGAESYLTAVSLDWLQDVFANVTSS